MNVPLYVDHVTSAKSGYLIERVRSKGQIVYGEVLAASLIVGDPHNPIHITAPPIRSNPQNYGQLLRFLAS